MNSICHFLESKMYYMCLMMINVPAIIMIPVKVFYCREHVDDLSLILWAAICLYEFNWFKKWKAAKS